MSSASASLVPLSTYWTTVTKGRSATEHGFTVKSLFDLRRKQQLAPIMISFNWLMPFMSSTQNQIKMLEQEADRTGKNPEHEQLVKILSESASSATKHWIGIMTRVGLQTAIASALMHKNTDLTNSLVLHWDMYPRMHQKYAGDLLEKLYLPRSISGLLGPATQPGDVELWELKVSPNAALQDSFKRHVLVTVSNVTVTAVLHYLHFGFGKSTAPVPSEGVHTSAEVEAGTSVGVGVHTNQSMTFVQAVRFTVITEGLSLLGCMLGSAAGRVVGGGRSEYWGEFIGAFVAGALGTYVSMLQSNTKKKVEDKK